MRCLRNIFNNSFGCPIYQEQDDIWNLIRGSGIKERAGTERKTLGRFNYKRQAGTSAEIWGKKVNARHRSCTVKSKNQLKLLYLKQNDKSKHSENSYIEIFPGWH